MNSPYKAHEAQLEATECPELFSQYDSLGEYLYWRWNNQDEAIKNKTVS